MANSDKATVADLIKNGKGEIRIVKDGRSEKLGLVTEVKIPYEAKITNQEFIDTGSLPINEGYEKTGTMTLAYTSSPIRDYVYALAEQSEEDEDFELPPCILILENKGSAKTGNQRLVFNGVRLISFSIFQSQAGKGAMTEQVKFVYESFKPTEKFSRAR